MGTSELTPKQAVSILANEGITVSEEEAEKILEFIYFFAEITIAQILNSKEGKLINIDI